MFLKRLEMQGFKSFADRTVLEFKPGITSVIGPNGSGKSNIVDAIRWVLGEQSIKSLRGAKSDDVIFAGTQNRKSVGFAEVSIVIDNSDQSLPIEYNEVVVSRKLYRSGETGYFINKVSCRLKDILQLFMDTGIGKDGYSIIGQGRIDEILSNKSEDRRHIFEEAAGIVKYRVRKEESEKKLEQTKLNLLRINDILSEIEGQIEPLKQQSEKARKFLTLREELKNIEVGLFVYNINTYKEKLEQLVKDIDIIVAQRKFEDDKLNKLQNKKENLKEELASIDVKIERVQNLGFESKTEIEKINSDINIYKEKILNNSDNAKRYSQDIVDLNNKISELKNERINKISKKDNLSSNKKKFETELEEKEIEMEKITEKLSKKEIEIENKKKKVEEDIDRKYERLNELNAYNINFENLEKKEKLEKENLQSIISELDSARLNKQEITKEFLKIDGIKNKKSKEITLAKNEKNKYDEQIKKFQEILNNLMYDYRMKDSRLKFLQETEREKEGYVKSVKSLLTACESESILSKGVNGVLANLISVDKKYEVAIEMCLGQTMQNIVTENEEDAKRLIEFLRENKLGRASFLPISSVHGKKLEKINKGNIEGIIGLAADLVKFDNKYSGIINNLLGRTIIVENMDSAIKLSKLNHYAFKIVTLTGDIINPSGAITGGSANTKIVNILGRGREIEELKKELTSLKQKVSKEKEKQEEYLRSISTNEGKLESLENDLKEIEIKYATENQKMKTIDLEIMKLEEKSEKTKLELKNIKKNKEEIIASKEGIKQVIENIEIEVVKINNEIAKFVELNKDNQEYIDNLNMDITDLKISVSSFNESTTSIDEMIERIDTDLNNTKFGIVDKEKEVQNIKDEIKKLEQNIIFSNDKINEIKEEVKNSSIKIEELKEQKNKNNLKQEELDESIEKQFDIINEIKEQILKFDNKKTRFEQDIEDLINKLWEEYEITPNNAQDYKKPNNIQDTQKYTNEIREQIKQLGSVNIDAIEEYKKMQERYDFMNEQRGDLENSIAKLRNIISDMLVTMKDQFLKKFKQININFNEVFIQLFGGGKGELSLEDESNLLECGINIKVQPPGKKLQNMMLLSGGEKALTAIAILFAILKINPAPFCILDEIEAALDDINVNRFAQYLNKFSDNTQFLIITHRKGTMEIADTVYGVTMEEKGISKLLSIKLS